MKSNEEIIKDVQQMLDKDPITPLVKQCNEILAPMGLKVAMLGAKGEEDKDKPYSIWHDQKLYTDETLKKVEDYLQKLDESVEEQ